MADFGYDISDYTGIDPLFGTMADFDALVEATHETDLKLIFDLVPNHTSDRHPWFIESRSSRSSTNRDWYIWHDGAPGAGPPTNWLSEFGGSAWKYDEVTDQYYYHAFLARQPDLNWRNPRVRHAIYDVMGFWSRKGVDGFRVDVIWHLIKDDQLGAHLPFNFSLLSATWTARNIENIIREYERALPSGAWPNWVLGNHDRPRIASRIGKEQARIAAMLLLTLRGTPTHYYGDEIGMQQVPIAPEQVRDPFEKNVPGLGVGRDGRRTPMQWDATTSAGFSSTTPWLPVANDFGRDNVANLDADTTSILNLYRALINLRRGSRALQDGTYDPIAAENDLLIYARRGDDTTTVVILNLAADPLQLCPKRSGLWAKSSSPPSWTEPGKRFPDRLICGETKVLLSDLPFTCSCDRSSR